MVTSKQVSTGASMLFVLATLAACGGGGGAAAAPKAWGAAAVIGTKDSAHAAEPQFAFDARGNALAVWQEYDGTRISIWANRFTVRPGHGVGKAAKAC